MDQLRSVLTWLRGAWSASPPRRGSGWWIWSKGSLTRAPPPSLITSDFELWSSTCEGFSNVRVENPRPVLQQLDRDGLKQAELAQRTTRLVCPYAVNASGGDIPPLLELPAPYFQMSGTAQEDLTIYCIQPEDATAPVAALLSAMCATLGQGWQYPHAGFRRTTLVIAASGNASRAHFLELTTGRRMMSDLADVLVEQTLTLLNCAVPMSVCATAGSGIVVVQLDAEREPHAARDIMTAHTMQERLFMSQLFQSALRSALMALHTLRLLWSHAHIPVPSDCACLFCPELYRVQTSPEWVWFEGGHVVAAVLPHSMYMDTPDALPIGGGGLHDTTLLVRAPPRPGTRQQSIVDAAREQVQLYPDVLRAAGISPQELGSAVGLYVRSDVRSSTGVLFRIAHIAFNCFCIDTTKFAEGDSVDGRPMKLAAAGITENSQRSAWSPTAVQWGLSHGGREWIALALKGALTCAVVHRHSANQGRLRVPDSLRAALEA